jgi:hypothetical protein
MKRRSQTSDPVEALVLASMEKKLKAASRSTEGWKNTAIKRAVWNDDADEHGGTLCFTGMRSVQIPDQITWNQWKSDPSGSMPD